MISNLKIPTEVRGVTETLEKNGYEAYIVGGCVRDLILKKKPKDWDITTNAKPEDIIKIFPKTFYENTFGTVGVVDENTDDETVKVIEVTPYRLEAKYSDGRRPDHVIFSSKLEDDLKRRDFTINAIAYSFSKGQIIDLYGGLDDIKRGVIKTVGDPNERFNEDGLRILRAIRISAELGFTINTSTEKAIKKNPHLLKNISQERIRDEFIRIIMSPSPDKALILSNELGILEYILPEIKHGLHVKQNQAHSYDVWTHLLKSLAHATKKGYPFHVKLAALLHDVGKPATRRWLEAKKDWTFYGHEVVGAKIAENALKRLKFSRETIEKVVKLVRWHMFFSDTEKITLSAVRRIIMQVGKENIWDLINVRICDRVGTGRPKETPYRLRKYQSMIEEAMRDPISVGMLKIDGNKIMEVLKILPGPKIGYILHALLEEVLYDPKLNTKDHLEKKAIELAVLSDEKLKKFGEKGKLKRESEDEKEIKEIRKKHWVE